MVKDEKNEPIQANLTFEDINREPKPAHLKWSFKCYMQPKAYAPIEDEKINIWEC